MYRKKKGQITLFIIIGVVLILGFGLFFYLRSRSLDIQSQRYASTVSDVPTEFRPIAAYVETCLTQVGEEAVKKLGQGGGYIDVDKHLDIEADDPTSGEGVAMTADSDIKGAYWSFMDSSNDCIGGCSFSSRMPLLHYTGMGNSVEEQLAYYVKDNIEDNCINDFEVFIRQGFEITELSIPFVESKVTEEFVAFRLVYKLRLKSASGAEQEIDTFITTIPVNLNEIFKAAMAITKMQRNTSFLERFVINLLDTHSGLDSAIPPRSGSEMKFGKGTTWKKDGVGKNVKDNILPLLQIITVDGSKNYNTFEGSERAGDAMAIRKVSELPVPVNIDVSNLDIKFSYLPWWKIYFDMNCKGQTCGPSSLDSGLLAPLGALIGIKKYNFIYDISYPVMVTIHDSEALNKKGYTFRFFLEGNVRAGEPLSAGEFSSITVEPPDVTMFTDEMQRISEPQTFNIADSVTLEKIDGAEILYTCIDETVNIGKTVDGFFSGSFPLCIGGFISLMKERYITKVMDYDVFPGKSNSETIYLDPILKKKVKVLTRPYVKHTIMTGAPGEGYEDLTTGPLPGMMFAWKLQKENDYLEMLDEGDKANIMIKREPTANELRFTRNILLKGMEEGEIEIAPGNLHFDVKITTNRSIIIPPHGEIDQTTTLNNSFLGGIEFDYEVKPEDLRYYDTLVIYALIVDYYTAMSDGSIRLNDLEKMNQIEEITAPYMSKFKPKWE